MDWRELFSNELMARGVSKSSLSSAMGVGAPQVTRLLQADSNPTVDTLERMANAAGLELVIGFRDVDATEATPGDTSPRAVEALQRIRGVCVHGNSAGCPACS